MTAQSTALRHGATSATARGQVTADGQVTTQGQVTAQGQRRGAAQHAGRVLGRLTLLSLLSAVTVSLAACTSGVPGTPGGTGVPTAPTSTEPAPGTPSSPGVTGVPSPDPGAQPGEPNTGPGPGVAAGPVEPTGEPVVLASGLEAPWSILRLPGGGALISERGTARVRELVSGGLRDAVTVPGVVARGEGGLLGLAYLAAPASASGAGASTGPGGWVYAYFTGAESNQIVRMPLTGTVGSLALGSPEPVLSGIPRAGNHDGGRIRFGPDGMLYATTGDAGDTARAQDLGSLGGKILRMTPTGTVPPDNPFGTLVYSYGHRNPQGIAWDSRGRLWASEFGQSTWDELNLITPGADYGWPEAEGIAHDSRYTDPVVQWRTSEASPSGLAIVGDTLFVAALRGERLWRVDSSTGAATAWFVNTFGRLRDVVPGPDGTLWFVTNNTDGRGTRAPGDDRLYSVRVVQTSPLARGTRVAPGANPPPATAVAR
ncbi:PQQ-dependent sugar dehydrogenase [Cryobacterium sp. RTS3]|uniref:PQQ-dependent sugar dehydrogenase n=1 Tax=Cryobacterium sp. RTS3 TaxID=3048643 RepID=UPI002B230790|nr:PQQ-dependent sugar dehydrogenase [Cryobacterium sp. RTS3]